MKPAAAISGSCRGPLQELKKTKSKEKNQTNAKEGKGGQRDRIKEYMEQKFYEQFMPKRDYTSRIRRPAIAKDTLRPSPLKAAAAAAAAATRGDSALKGEQAPKKPARKQKKRKEKKKKSNKGRQQPTTKGDICAMVLSHMRDL
ncbi:hypothetical protein, conserved [Eimeria brunetti]|uniref:Uncharacterized protein n=1 Tax=Eimeria brunetti TaxID=51314 RepID=U6LTU5_9EIME|nr:hypothetical protein, conserved [Eimeria brunetti]